MTPSILQKSNTGWNITPTAIKIPIPISACGLATSKVLAPKLAAESTLGPSPAPDILLLPELTADPTPG